MPLHDEVIDEALGPLLNALIDDFPDHGIASMARHLARAAFVRGYGAALESEPNLQVGLAASILDVSL